MLFPHCPDYCELIPSLEVIKTSNFILLSQVVFAILAPLSFNNVLESIFQYCYKKACWDFDWDCIESLGPFEENCHLKNI